MTLRAAASTTAGNDVNDNEPFAVCLPGCDPETSQVAHQIFLWEAAISTHFTAENTEWEQEGTKGKGEVWQVVWT